MPVAIEVGCTNVYADLGYADAAEMQRKAFLVSKIACSIKSRKLTPVAASELLGIDQVQLSRITRGQFRDVSEAKLLGMLRSVQTSVHPDCIPIERDAMNGSLHAN